MSDARPPDPRPKGNKATLSLPELQHLLGRAVADKELRRKLLKDPDGTLRKLGYPNHPAAVEFFRKLGAEGFDKAADAFTGAEGRRGDPAFDHGET